MRIRKQWAMRLGAAVVALALSVGTALAAQSLIPVGRAAGIKLHADGVMIASVDPVTTAVGQVSPAEAAGLQPGDVILTVSGQPVDTNDGIQQQIADAGGKPLALHIRRDGKDTSMLVKRLLQNVSYTTLVVSIKSEKLTMVLLKWTGWLKSKSVVSQSHLLQQQLLGMVIA